MIDSLYLAVDKVLGLDADQLTAWQMVLRAAVIYQAGIAVEVR